MQTRFISGNGERDRLKRDNLKNRDKQGGIRPQEGEMAIVRAPMKTDASGKCTRWRVILYNPATHKQEWHTVKGSERDAKAFQRGQETRLSKGTYIAKAERLTLSEVAESFLKECRARSRRTSTMLNYRSVLHGYILPRFGTWEAGSIRKADVRAWLSELLESGTSIELANRIIRVFKTVLFHGVVDIEVIERNVLMRFKQYERGELSVGRRVNRSAFTEQEVQKLLSAARPRERALIGLLCFTGMRPGEAFALRWEDVDLIGGSAKIERTWDWRGKMFTAPKTGAGNRTVALSGWLVEELKAHQERTGAGSNGLLFATRTGQAMNPSNVRRDVWTKLVKRAGVRALDMYSLRHTFASFGRVAGESAFNVARAMGHSRSMLVDQVYAHSLQSGMASVAERVTARALGEQPKLRVIEGGQRDVRQPLDQTPSEVSEKQATA
jgi:integrase